jgi:hypothetical protein
MRKQKTPALVNLAIYTTITVFLWIFFDVYRALKKAPVLDIDNKTLEPVNPNLDKNLLDEIYQSVYYDKSSLENYIYIPTLNTEEKLSTESSKINQ